MIKKFKQNSYFEATQLDNEWIILNSEDFTVTRINDVGGFCWSLLETPQTLDSLIEAIIQEYESDIERVSKDVEVFLDRLNQHGLVQHVI